MSEVAATKRRRSPIVAQTAQENGHVDQGERPSSRLNELGSIRKSGWVEVIDRRKAELVKFLLLAGLTAEQAAAALGVSTSTAEKDWAYAGSWLRVAIDRMSGHRP